MLNVDLESRCKWDPPFAHKDFKVIEDNRDKGEYLCYVPIEMPVPLMATRDKVNRVIFREDWPKKGSYCVSS
jgi:hypothetical protein